MHLITMTPLIVTRRAVAPVIRSESTRSGAWVPAWSRSPCASERRRDDAIYYEIKEPYQGRGYGKASMGLVLAEAKRSGLPKVRIAVDDDNPTSRHIIESHRAVWLEAFARREGAHCHLFEVRFT